MLRKLAALVIAAGIGGAVAGMNPPWQDRLTDLEIGQMATQEKLGVVAHVVECQRSYMNRTYHNCRGLDHPEWVECVETAWEDFAECCPLASDDLDDPEPIPVPPMTPFPDDG